MFRARLSVATLMGLGDRGSVEGTGTPVLLCHQKL